MEKLVELKISLSYMYQCQVEYCYPVLLKLILLFFLRPTILYGLSSNIHQQQKHVEVS